MTKKCVKVFGDWVVMADRLMTKRNAYLAVSVVMMADRRRQSDGVVMRVSNW